MSITQEVNPEWIRAPEGFEKREYSSYLPPIIKINEDTLVIDESSDQNGTVYWKILHKIEEINFKDLVRLFRSPSFNLSLSETYKQYINSRNNKNMTTIATTNPLSLLETRLQAFFETVKDDVLKFADAFFPKVEAIVEVALEDLAEIAGKAVLAQASSVLSGQEKFGAAVTDVVQTVEASGKTVALSSAQTAVQAAFSTAQTIVLNNKKA